MDGWTEEDKVKKNSFLLGISLLIIATAILYVSKNPRVQESITFFPIDPKVTFKSAETSLKLIDKATLLWSIQSTLDRKAYLRQDVGFLFSNGRLIGNLGDWKQNTARIRQEKRMEINNSAFLEAITFHHAELHEEGGQIFSSQVMSSDQLYVILSASNTLYSFHTPRTNEQIVWKQRLGEQTERMLRYSWNKGVRRFSIHLNEYHALPLILFNRQAKSGLPNFTKKGTDRIVGNLWEGLYKNYLHGIKKADGTEVSPLGSTIPLILIAKNKTHLLVLSETANGEPIMLRQMIEDVD